MPLSFAITSIVDRFYQRKREHSLVKEMARFGRTSQNVALPYPELMFILYFLCLKLNLSLSLYPQQTSPTPLLRISPRLLDHWHLRLAAGEGRCDGRVEVYHSGVWGRVTDDLWDFKDADVVCRQLKCGSAVNVYNHGKYGIGKGPVIMSNVSCIGDDIPVRLLNGSSRCAGRVEVYYNGIWGTVCDDAWDLTDADVVCKEMNCGHAVNATKTSWFGQGSGPIWLDNLKCSVNNTALWQCPARPWGENDCIHKEDAGVICSGHRKIRLADGKNPCQGRLEVFFNGTWGTVCSDSFGIENAQVVCSQLNCGSAKLVENSAAFGEGTGQIWLDDVRCRLGDSLLWQCPSSAWGQHNCKHEEDVGITCSEIWPAKPLIEEVKKEKIINPFPKASSNY
ncbi:scavenger receptor cysteine-rich domain-containing protein DMBT1-like [Hemitrygon akajei]|uniref:scavenger receptor cysteine-rich domain-containing protein DMBT1-like n=1 Tax=Hemitrygon akajei TaxID=2704970 RepID=UPI003BF9FCE8